jgi:hypothetical protein
MTIHHDLGWWGFVLGIAALVLTYPISLLANLTSPAIKNWWAERSVASLQKRIRKLEQQLAEYDTREMLTEGMDRLLVGVEVLGFLTSMTLMLVDLAFLTGAMQLVLVNVMILPKVPLLTLIIATPILAFLLLLVIVIRVTRFRVKHSPWDREQLRSSLAQLTKKANQKSSA